MKITRVSADVKFSRTPVNSLDAYNLLIEALTDDIKQKKAVLEEMRTAQGKRVFIENWEPGVKSITMHE